MTARFMPAPWEPEPHHGSSSPFTNTAGGAPADPHGPRQQHADEDRERLESAIEAKEQARLRAVAALEQLRNSRSASPAAGSLAARLPPHERAEGGFRRALRRLRRMARTTAALGLLPGRGRTLRRSSLKLVFSPAHFHDAEVVASSGLFDDAYYLTANPDVAISGAAPLAHFVLTGAVESRSPHPLFDPAYYRRHNPDVAEGVNPLVHYCRFGAAASRSPHPLFDSAFYLHNNPDVRGTGVAPLTHFLRFGGAEGRNPNPLFDCAYYLQANPDVAMSGGNPLVHYVTQGWREGRRPSAGFDPAYYIATYQDIARSGQEPLAHYLEYGRSEGRRPAADPERPADHEVEAPATAIRVMRLAPAPAAPPVIVCLTHVMPAPPRAGNEYRILRLLRWLRDRGYRIVPVVAPLPAERVDADGLRQLAAEFSNAVLCGRDGSVQYILETVPDTLGSLAGEFTRPVSLLLDDDGSVRGSHQVDLLRMDRMFCHDVLISAVSRLQHALGPHVLLAEYIWMTRVLPLAAPDVIKIVDTIDVFSTKREKVLRFGIDDLHVEPAEEAKRLRRADLIVAIQENEHRELQQLAPEIPVVTAGVDFDVAASPPSPEGRRVLYVASGNPMNRKGLDDFLRFAWPRVRDQVKDAELLLAGDVGAALSDDTPGVVRLGRVADLAPLYGTARVVINPAIAGTGVKIKTLEALAHFRPVVTWPTGVDGVAPELIGLCDVVRDWYAFGNRLATLLALDPAPAFSAGQQELIRTQSAPETVYRAFTQALERAMEQRWREPAGSRSAPLVTQAR